MYACIPPLKKGPPFFLAFCRFCIHMLFSCRRNLKRVKSSMVFVGSEWFFADFYKKSADSPFVEHGLQSLGHWWFQSRMRFGQIIEYITFATFHFPCWWSMFSAYL
jgi:hypothetical protein